MSVMKYTISVTREDLRSGIERLSLAHPVVLAVDRALHYKQLKVVEFFQLGLTVELIRNQRLPGMVSGTVRRFGKLLEETPVLYLIDCQGGWHYLPVPPALRTPYVFGFEADIPGPGDPFRPRGFRSPFSMPDAQVIRYLPVELIDAD